LMRLLRNFPILLVGIRTPLRAWNIGSIKSSSGEPTSKRTMLGDDHIPTILDLFRIRNLFRNMAKFRYNSFISRCDSISRWSPNFDASRLFRNNSEFRDNSGILDHNHRSRRIYSLMKSAGIY
jgi:hypothetical protein